MTKRNSKEENTRKMFDTGALDDIVNYEYNTDPDAIKPDCILKKPEEHFLPWRSYTQLRMFFFGKTANELSPLRTTRKNYYSSKILRSSIEENAYLTFLQTPLHQTETKNSNNISGEKRRFSLEKDQTCWDNIVVTRRAHSKRNRKFQMRYVLKQLKQAKNKFQFSTTLPKQTEVGLERSFCNHNVWHLQKNVDPHK